MWSLPGTNRSSILRVGEEMAYRKIIVALLFLVSVVSVVSCSRMEKPSMDDCKSAISKLSGQAVRDPKNIEIVGIGEYDKKRGWECKTILTELDGRKTGYIFYIKKMVKPGDPDQVPKWRVAGAKLWTPDK
jgi:hypothetical protein